jgi:lauroyl/myristoyl acyltransferase
MNLQKIATSRFGVGLGLAIGSAIPPRIGYRLANWFAGSLARREESPMVAAVRQNQWVVRDCNLSQLALEQAVQEVFSHAGRCFVDLYHNLRNPEGIKALVSDSPQTQALIRQSQEGNQGVFIVAPHVSNFDLCLLSLAYRGLRGQVLTYGQPTGGYQIQNDLRAKTGLEITPVSPEVHRQAIESLEKGGFVITAVDRPIRRKAHSLLFFDRPCPLPAGHVRMALEARVPIIVASASMDEHGMYHILFSDPIPMEEHADPVRAIQINGEKVLQEIETRIRRNPGQWLMYYPAWPDVEVSPQS